MDPRCDPPRAADRMEPDQPDLFEIFKAPPQLPKIFACRGCGHMWKHRLPPKSNDDQRFAPPRVADNAAEASPAPSSSSTSGGKDGDDG